MKSSILVVVWLMGFFTFSALSYAEDVEWKPEYQKLAQIDAETAAAEKQKKKLAQIDAEIAAAEKQKKAGRLKVLAGLGSQIVALTVFVPSTSVAVSWDGVESNKKGNEALFQIAFWGGSAAVVWGFYQWWDGAQTASMLKAKRYDISLRPEIKLDSDGSRTVAFALKVGF